MIFSAMSKFDATQWLLFAIAVSAAIVAFTALAFLGFLRQVMKINQSRMSFRDHAQSLLDEGQLSKLIDACHARMEMFHDDANAHWYLGTALYRRGELRMALTYLNRVPTLQPGWDVSAMVCAIEDQLAEAGDRPTLKVVAPSDPLKPDVPPAGGTPGS